jgi:tetratricopeptide (TPR) repeat protein
MKKQSLRRSSRSIPPIPVRRQFDHVVPTVIHDPEEKMTALGRFTHRVFRNPRKYMSWVLWIAVVAVVAVVGWNLTTSEHSRTSEVWSKLDNAKKAEDRIAVAKQYPKSPASTWALLQAATEYYNLGLSDLPNNRDIAVNYFKKAFDLFDQAQREAPKDSFQARAAALGKGRALEARYKLPEAIEQYELVAETWPRSAEASEALDFAAALRQPEAAAFYKELYAYAPSKVTLPPFGTQKIEAPPAGSSDSTTKSGSASKRNPFLEMPLELSPPNVDELPANVFATKPAAPRKESPPK